jgi:hypothetical protein
MLSAMGSATKNFHIPLPESTYAELTEAAASAGFPATKFAQALLRRGLDEVRRGKRRREIAAYASAVAGSADDLDPWFEAATVEHLLGKKR